jgi:asparagine synthase (glutamine-hydrolysing)
MDQILPSEILSREKIGFRIPVAEWFRGPYREFVCDALLSETSQLNVICDDRVVRRIVNDHIEGRVNNEKILWSLVNLELFLRTYKPSGIDDIRARAA